MNICNYNKITKEFVSQTIANKNPLEKGKYLIPANATTIEVLNPKDGFKIYFNEELKEWEYLEIPTVYVFDSETNEYKSSHKNTFLIEYKQFKIKENETIIKPLINKENFAVCFNKDKQEWEYKEDNRNKIVYSTITKEASIIDYLGVIKDDFTLLVPNEFDKWENSSWVIDENAIQNNFRQTRDNILSTVVDHYQKPLVWETLTIEQQDKVRAYRQALLDSTNNWVLPEELAL